jgi:hypothetical protein
MNNRNRIAGLILVVGLGIIVASSPVSADEITRRKFAQASDEFCKCAAFFAVAGSEYENSDKNLYSKYLSFADKAKQMAVIAEAAASSNQDQLEIGSSEHRRIESIVLERTKKYINAMWTISREKTNGMDLLHVQFGDRCIDAHENPTVFLR